LARAGRRRTGFGAYILDHIVRAARTSLPYVFLGYWVEESRRMAYKSRFRPLERLGREAGAGSILSSGSCLCSAGTRAKELAAPPDAALQ
jgi:hypothetical protein